MASIFKLFAERGQGNAAATAEDASPAAPPMAAAIPNQIQFDSKLVDELKQDHVGLVAQFTQMVPLFRSSEIRTFRAQLASFKTQFQGHIIKENVRFYVYLEQTLAGDETNVELMRDFRREMNAISRAVVGFCNKYNDAKPDLQTIRQFEAEAGDIGKALLSRIDREERDLYSLYR